MNTCLDLDCFSVFFGNRYCARYKLIRSLIPHEALEQV